jgi:NADP-dependent 3-hydroxy acid dehydrogenase YdfG
MPKTAVITGTSSGLGLDLANHFINEGWRVIGLSRKPSPINSQNFTQKIVDIQDYKSVEFVFKELKNEALDLLINNAATFTMTEFCDTDINTINTIIDTNLKGSIYVCKYALSLLNKDSRIIFINSVAGLEELEKQSIYCASKYALTGFAGVLGKELRSKRIKVVSIHSGGINTPLWNTSNPYPCGNVSEAIPTQEITKLISFIVNSPVNIEYKTIKLFPSLEWHN